jgi:CCR4-NOT transcription complex subunit 2
MDAASSASSVTSGVEGLSGSEFLNLNAFASQQQQLGGDQQQQLLVGSSAFAGSSSLGLVSNGFVDGGSFDLSDFPSLAGTGGAPGSSNGLAAALRQQQLLVAAQQQHSANSNMKNANNLYRLAMNSNAGLGANGTNFSMTTEDFPALGGTALGQQQAPMGSSLLASQRAPSSGMKQSLVGGGNNNNGGYAGSDFAEHGTSNESSAAAGLLGGAGLGGLGPALQQQHHSSATGAARTQQQSHPALSAAVGSGSATQTAAATSGGGNALAGDYGLLGLLAVIRMTDADRNALALGSDLTLLGLNLGSAEQIYSTFSSPWLDAPVTKEPHYQVRLRQNET